MQRGSRGEDTETESRGATSARGRRRLAVPIAAGGMLAALGTVGACTFTQPSRARVGAPPADLQAESVRIANGSGGMLAAWLSMGREGHGSVLLLHGVGANRLAMLERARFLRRAGHTVLLVDLQAHGESDGARITFGHLESRDAAAAAGYLRARRPYERLAVVGVSMGGAAAVLGDGPLAADAFVLESVYPTIEHATRDRLRAWLGPFGGPLAPLALRMIGSGARVDPSDLRPLDRVGRIAAPVLMLAGTADRYTTIAESRALFRRVAGPKEFWAVSGAGHVDLHRFARAEYERRVGQFLLRHLRARTAAPALAGAGR